LPEALEGNVAENAKNSEADKTEIRSLSGLEATVKKPYTPYPFA